MTTSPQEDATTSTPPSARRSVAGAVAAAVLTSVVLAVSEIPVGWPVLPLGLGAAIVASVVDLRERRLPNRVLLPAIAAVIVFLLAAAAGNLTRSVLALSAGGAAMLLYGLIWWLRPAAMGYGDVKLAGLLAMTTGWLSITAALSAVVIAFALASVLALGLLLTGRARSTEIPFGPFMTAGALFAAALHLSG